MALNLEDKKPWLQKCQTLCLVLKQLCWLNIVASALLK